MRELLLHIGHRKTGSTYLQNTFARNRGRLGDLGIHYPDVGEMAGKDPVLGVSGGNARYLLASPNELVASLRRLVRDNPDKSLLLSGEVLFYELAERVPPSLVLAAAQAAGFGKVRMLLFIRDPVPLARSRWQQDIKLGSTLAAADHFAENDEPTLLASLLDQLVGVPETDITIRNYSRCADRIGEIATEWLGTGGSDLEALPAKRVNRSLSSGELALKRAMNRVLQDPGILVNDFNLHLSDMQVEEPTPESDVQQALLDRLSPDIDRVNARLPEQDRYRLDLLTPRPLTGPFEFSEEQIEVIAKSLGGEISRLRSSVNSVRADPAAFLSIGQLAMGLGTRIARRGRQLLDRTNGVHENSS